MNDEKFAYRFYDLTNTKLPTGFTLFQVQRAQSAIRRVLVMDKNARREAKEDAYRELSKQLEQHTKKSFEKQSKKHQSQMKTVFGHREALHKELFKKLGTGPQTLSTEATKQYPAIRNLAYSNERSRFLHATYDPIVEGYEKRHLAAMTSLKSVKQKIRQALTGQYVVFCTDAGRVDITLTDKDEEEEVLIATLLLDAQRFKPLVDTEGVYVHVNSGRQYVRDANGIFVRRYLLRNMSAYDQPFVDGFKSRNGAVPMNADKVEAIVKHLRAAEQGESYFISFTSTRKDIFGSTGAHFYDVKKGQAIIDASKVPQEKLYDVHSLEAVAKIITSKEIRFNVEFEYGNIANELNAAARDTIRTREVLVEEKVDRAAIVAVRKPGIAKGKWVDVNQKDLTHKQRLEYECVPLGL